MIFSDLNLKTTRKKLEYTHLICHLSQNGIFSDHLPN